VVTLVLDEQPKSPVWSPDGKKLLFQSGVKDAAVIYQIDVDGQNKKLLTNGIDPAWQPLIDDGPEETTTSPAEPPAKSSAS
jgi:Tol biopolymer transport system component